MREVLPGIHWLSLSGMVNVYLVETSGGLTLVDAGMSQHAGRILRAAEGLAAASGPLRHIVITHGHSDHIGGAAAVQAQTGSTIWMHPAEAGALTTGAGNDFVMPQRSTAGSRLMRRLAPGKVRPASVGGELVDREPLPFAPEWRPWQTGGHTPGHCCFYNESLQVLITGDSVMHWFGRLSPPFAMATVDRQRNLDQVRRLSELEIETILFGHGPPLLGGAGATLRAWLASIP